MIRRLITKGIVERSTKLLCLFCMYFILYLKNNTIPMVNFKVLFFTNYDCIIGFKRVCNYSCTVSFQRYEVR